ncbi:MAG: hypothetical protein HY515_03660, partial [Candidatus Aenigmarchaeota archaeon]|nr:hypothetical protein [Candidatus Aenigmarchaeota archaeon]
MNLEAFRSSPKFKAARILLGMTIAFLFASFVYAELTSFGTQPPLAGYSASSPNNIFIHGWSDYNRALLNLSDIDIKNNSFSNYTCNATMCTWYAYIDNDNYT